MTLWTNITKTKRMSFGVFASFVTLAMLVLSIWVDKEVVLSIAPWYGGMVMVLIGGQSATDFVAKKQEPAE